MSAIVWRKLRQFESAPPCDGGCMTKAEARGVAQWRLFLMTRPAGFWCNRCRREMAQAWNSALDPEVDRETALVAA